MNVDNAVGLMKQAPGNFVDISFRQGRNSILRQLEKRSGRDESNFVDAFVEDAQDTISKLLKRSLPYIIPDEYIYFLETYGGLAIESDSHYFSVFGVGPMVEDWYSSIDSDTAFSEPDKYGFLYVGKLNFRRTAKYKFQHVSFFLDLAGIIQKYCIIGVGPWGKDGPTPSTIVKDIHTHSGMWQIIANSFSEWLQIAAETHGVFIYT